jgi:hypothetical protein
MFRSGLLFLLNLALFMFLFFGCGQGDDQRKFEQEAFRYPDGFTQTNHNEEIINGNEDPDDWRVAPFYQGLVFVDPAFPNPVLTNEQLTIRIHLPYIDTITDLNVYVLRDVNNYQFLR